ncbi:MAG: hypothetical protein SGI72_12140 [Planctomycetota bacterium]|nr:hypothetical protein [Planctomycetota bacterium]
MNMSLRICAAFVLVALPACLSGTGRIAQLYDNLAHEVASKDAVTLPTLSSDKKHEERADEVRAILERGGELSSDDAFKAAVLLVGTDRTADLVLAEQLAKLSTELGDKRGMRVMAEAIDKRLMLAELPQKYGTQFAFEFVLDSWRLYPIDPTTTDEIRASVMVPTYAELLEAEDAMNRAHGKKPRS